MLHIDKYTKLVEMKKKATKPLMAFEGREVSLVIEPFSATFFLTNSAPAIPLTKKEAKRTQSIYEEKKAYLTGLVPLVDKEFEKYYENAAPSVEIESVPQFEDIIFEVEAPGYVNIYAVNGLGKEKDEKTPSFVSDDFSLQSIRVEAAYPWLGILLRCENTRVKELMDAVIQNLTESEDYDEKAMGSILRGRAFYPFRQGK